MAAPGGKQSSHLALIPLLSLSACFLLRVNLIPSKFRCSVNGRRHCRTLDAVDRPLIDATFSFTIEANLLESFTGQGPSKGEEGAPAIRKIEPSADLEGTN